MWMFSTIMTFQILRAMCRISANRTQMPFLAMIFPIMILYAIVCFITDCTMSAPKWLFKWVTFFKMSSQFVCGRSFIATKSAYHWDGCTISKINPAFLWRIFFRVFILMSMIFLRMTFQSIWGTENKWVFFKKLRIVLQYAARVL